ncbi:hypothetical protein [Blastococcus capsensis]|uniref:hypothetical protein n=1 Tax=Blastococcus capsensis TaxID=1564163 RepID=UPI002541185F|nr:hypothetical protein [Blastococcus capsensis]MDK3255003.1 hypothetical protein [Blastococcus capsensis]
MTTSQLDDAFEAYLAGRPVPVQAASLAQFADSVREMSSRSGRPSAGLAELLASGLLTDSVDASAESAPTARGAAQPALPGRSRRRPRMFTILAAAAAKFGAAGAVAQAAAGLGFAAAGVTSAGAFGVLPGPVQDGVATTIEAVTPFDLPDSTDEQSAEEAAPLSEDPATDEQPQTGTGPADIPPLPDFGTSVSEDAQDGGVDGAQVSDDARATHQPEQAGAPEQTRAPADQAPERPATQPEPAPRPAPVERPAAGGDAATAPSVGQPQSGTGRP